jgi:uncharacterized damage-inducible protein DinB
MIKPDLPSVPPFYQGYVSLVKDNDLFDNLERSISLTQQLLRNIPEEKGDYAYAPGKWTIREVLCHVIDSERVFAYRALRFARNDKTPLAGFEEKDFAPEANAHNRTVADIAAEMGRLRTTTIDLYRSFSSEMLQRAGSANNTIISVLNLGFVIPGHETHHRRILSERYLQRA